MQTAQYLTTCGFYKIIFLEKLNYPIIHYVGSFQACIGNEPVPSSAISFFMKDVLAKFYGGNPCTIFFSQPVPDSSDV